LEKTTEVTVGKGQQTLDRLTFDGGTVNFGDISLGGATAENSLHTTSTLDISGSGKVQVNPGDVFNITPAAPPDIPLMAQDDGNALIQLISNTGTVAGSGGNLTLVDANGKAISKGVISDILQGGMTVAKGTYDYRLSSGENNDGLYINYGLTDVALSGTGADALILDGTGLNGNAADLSARLSGSGDLAITAGHDDVVSLSNSGSDYTGKTDVRGGTLAMGSSHALGNTAALNLAEGTVFAMKGHQQTVGELNAKEGSRTELEGGTLTLGHGGTVEGVLTGNGKLNVEEGMLSVNGANSGLTAAITLAKDAVAVLDNTQGLGSGNIILDGTLKLADSFGSLANSLSQQGTVALQNSNVILAGDNETFGGNFTVDDRSSLTADSARQLGTASVLNAGELVLNVSESWEVENQITGTGDLRKTGAGTIVLNENSAGLTGQTTIEQGEIRLGSAQAPVMLSSSNVVIGENGQLSGYGGIAGNLKNSGQLVVGGDSAGNQLVVNGNYEGNNGTLHLNSVLEGDRSITDRLIVNGNTSGTTAVSVNNIGGSGAQTLNGIEVVHVAGESSGEFTQKGRIVAGAYDYSLVRGKDDKAQNWYLTSQHIGGGDGNTGSGNVNQLRPEAGSYAANLAAANTMFITRYHERAGVSQYLDPVTGQIEETTLWMRNEGGHTRSRAGEGQLKTTSNRYVLQMGGELVSGSTTGDDLWRVGAMAGYGHESSNTRSTLSGHRSEGSVNGYSVGLYGGWTADAVNQYGLYVDGWLQYGWFDNSAKGQGIQSEDWNSSGFTASLETGYTWSLGTFEGSQGSKNEWLIQPQAQAVWMGVKADDHKEANGTTVKGEGDGNIQTRLGVRTLLRSHHAMDEGKSRQFQPYAELNWIHNTKEFGTRFNDMTVSQQGAKNVAELKLGVEGQVNKNLSLWGNVGEQLGNNGYSDTSGMIGVKYRF
jgi:outer membrane autotransporter barrel domain